MKLKLNAILMLALLATLSVTAEAQLKPDSYGAASDTIFAEISKIDDFSRSITISCFNDEDIIGIAVPLQLSAGMTKVIADSGVYAGGRVEDWDYKAFRADTAIQCVLLATIASLSAEERVLSPGYGRLATIFVSGADGAKIDELSVDTTTMAPDNSLMMIVDRVIGTPPDTVKLNFADRQFAPVWVVRESESPQTTTSE